jgi:hypothetical protein
VLDVLIMLRDYELLPKCLAHLAFHHHHLLLVLLPLLPPLLLPVVQEE